MTKGSKAEKVVYKTKDSQSLSRPLDELQCFICAEHEPKYWAVTPCGHRVCWLCLLRLRALYEKKACPMCKQECERVLITAKNTGAKFERGAVEDEVLGLWLETQAVAEQVRALLEQRCPQAGCGKVLKNKADLRRHVQEAHNLLMCDICLSHQKAFSHEYRLFDKAGLWRHQRGEDKSHPLCKICGTLFYSDDELAEHCRHRHERCHLCHRQQPHAFNYLRDYHALEAHFRTAHFLCPEAVCLEAKFVVFESELEYRAHVAQMHLGDKKMQRSMEKQLRRIDGSFLVHPTRSVPGRENAAAQESRPVQYTMPAVPAQPSHAAVQESAASPQINCSGLVYGEAIGPLAARLQSLSLYVDRNEELLGKIPPAKHSSFRAHCRLFQEGRLRGSELIHRLNDLLGFTLLKNIHPLLAELELDTFKRKDLEMQMTALEHRQQAFPTLPTTGGRDVVPPRAIARSQGSGGGHVLQIKPRSQVRPKGSVDFTRNPTALLNTSVSSATLIKPKPLNKPSFQHALQVGSGTSVGIMAELPRAALVLDEEEFPSLVKPPAAKPLFSEEGESRPEAFTLGGQEEEQEGEPKGKGKGPKRKGQVVLRFG